MTKQNPYEKTLKKFLILLSLFVVSPIILSIAFKALKTYKETPENLLAYSLLIIGIFLMIYTVYFGFKTFKLLLDTLFRK